MGPPSLCRETAGARGACLGRQIFQSSRVWVTVVAGFRHPGIGSATVRTFRTGELDRWTHPSVLPCRVVFMFNCEKMRIMEYSLLEWFNSYGHSFPRIVSSSFLEWFLMETS